MLAAHAPCISPGRIAAVLPIRSHTVHARTILQKHPGGKFWPDSEWMEGVINQNVKMYSAVVMQASGTAELACRPADSLYNDSRPLDFRAFGQRLKL